MANPPPSLNPAPIHDIENNLYERLFHKGYHLNKCIFKASTETKFQGAIDYKGNRLIIDSPVTTQRVFVFAILIEDNTSGSVLKTKGKVLQDERVNVYFNFKHNAPNSRQFRLGSTFVSDDRDIRGHARLEYDSHMSAKEVKLTTRGMWRNENFIANFVQTFNLSNLKSDRMDYSLGYKYKKFYLIGTEKNLLKMSVLGKYEDITYGCRYKYDVATKQNSFVVAAKTKIENYKVKGKANLTNPNIKLSLKGQLNQQFAFALAAQLPFGEGYKDDKKSKYMPFPVGFTIKTNL